MESLYEAALGMIDKNEGFALATVITLDGSAPRGPGAKMIIRSDKSIVGTIGGGLLEARVMAKAVTVIKEKIAQAKEFRLNKSELSDIDMICGGDLDVLIDYIDPTDIKNKEIFEYLTSSAKGKELAYLVTLIPENEKESKVRKHFILIADGRSIGFNAPDSEDEIRTLAFEGDAKYKVVETKSKRQYIVESANVHHKAYIFGAGHVGQTTAKILKFLDFHVTVIDDREQFANAERFPDTDKIIVDDFEESFGSLAIDRYSYLIIVTRGHVKDQEVLALSLKTNAGYIGMIGSAKKREGVYDYLVSLGFERNAFDRVYNPIGLPIFADSPEEIAISIAAEIIKVRAELTESNH